MGNAQVPVSRITIFPSCVVAKYDFKSFKNFTFTLEPSIEILIIFSKRIPKSIEADLNEFNRSSALASVRKQDVKYLVFILPFFQKRTTISICCHCAILFKLSSKDMAQKSALLLQETSMYSIAQFIFLYKKFLRDFAIEKHHRKTIREVCKAARRSLFFNFAKSVHYFGSRDVVIRYKII